MRIIPQVSKRGGKIGRADEDGIHAVDRGDRLERIHGRAGFELHQHAHLVVRPRKILRHAAVAVRAVDRRHALDAARGG